MASNASVNPMLLDLLKDRLLKASLAEDIKNIVIISCEEIRNKDLHDETERISNESKDVSNESKTADTHKSRENNSLKSLQKENENFMASLQIENAHLKQIYKDLFESVQRSRVETNHCDEVKVKIDELEKSLAKQTKENSDLLMKIDNLDNVFADEEKRATFGKWNAFDKENCDFGSKVIHLEKIIAQKSKDFDDVNLELSNRTPNLKRILKNFKIRFERKLARKVDDSKAEKDQFLKEINHLRTQFENLKGKSVKTKFGKSSILGKPPAEKLLIKSQLSKSWFTPKIVVQKDLSKPVTAQSLPKNEKDQLLKLKFDSLNRKKWKINVSKSSKPKESVSEKFNNILEKIEFFKKTSGAKHNLFENETSVFQIKIDELEKSLAKQTKENSDLLMKIDNLENVFADEEKKATFRKWNAFDKENCDFGSKNTKFEAYFEKLENTKVVLERKLTRKVDDSKAEKD
ncbi:hypothetical protein Tco_0272339 [Tanacetum coccineum]